MRRADNVPSKKGLASPPSRSLCFRSFTISQRRPLNPRDSSFSTHGEALPDTGVFRARLIFRRLQRPRLKLWMRCISRRKSMRSLSTFTRAISSTWIT